MDEPFTISTSSLPDTNYMGTQSNLGTAYAKLSGGISGTGSLTINAVGWHNGSNSNTVLGLSSGMVAVPGGINVSGPIRIDGGGLYVPSIASLASNNVGITGGGVLASSGTANITYGAGIGQIQYVGGFASGYGGGFAAMGGPLVIYANNNQPIGFRYDGSSFNPTGDLVLGTPSPPMP